MQHFDPEFERFWKAYPHRPGNPKTLAYRKWLKLTKQEGYTADTILAGAKAYAETRAGEDPKFTAMASTFLNQYRFMDEYKLKTVNETVLCRGFYAKADSSQLAAWDAVYRARKGINGPRDRKGGWWFPTEWPPVAAEGGPPQDDLQGNVVPFGRKAG